ncbi:transcriptional regulator [Thalassoroseus pseudoceratinae]|uniref:transcriptional regulator n=1 Tax=Thalassoroseus pseudoceratinae TaxID=2713176 RepID=UPI00141E4A65|nr:transcriptional regulator [Thalassoroseus pseudoceratinae]
MSTSNSRLPDSVGDELPRELIDFAKVIARLPAHHQPEVEEAYNRVVDSVRRRRRILTLVQEALAQLRLDIKYLMFDLEMTRRERDELKHRLEE